MLGCSERLKVKINPAGGITVDFTGLTWNQLPNTWSWVLKIENLDNDYREPKLYEAIQFVKSIKRGHQTE